MDLKNRGRVLAAGLFAGALLGGGLAMVTPAGAVVQDAAAAINWKTIWKTEIKPRAKKTFYTKKASNARYYTKVQTDSLYETKAAHDASMAAALGNYYTKAQSDANYYSKAQSDAKYAPMPGVIRGTYALGGTATAANQPFADSIAFGWTLSAEPTVHYIKAGDPVPVGCSGTVAAPNASPGHLCVFETLGGNVTTRDIDRAAGTHPAASPFGANIWAYSTAAGPVFVYGSWAVRPLVAVTNAAPAFKSPQGGGTPTGR